MSWVPTRGVEGVKSAKGVVSGEIGDGSSGESLDSEYLVMPGKQGITEVYLKMYDL